MADTPNNIPPDQLRGDDMPERDASEEFYPQEEMEVEQPRRAASAEFVVEGKVGSTAVMREAMDPANQSLADALRLSYRVLQAVMVVLIALFLVSGFQSIGDDQSGVMLRFGRIVEKDGKKSLDRGLQQSWLPYPAGEFVLFQVTNLSIDLGSVFWPELRPGETTEDAKERVAATDPISPSKTSGSVLAQGGDIAHLQLSAKYEIADPAKFVTLLQPGRDGHSVVRLALQSATVRSVAETPLESLIERTDETKAQILQHAQAMLDGLDTGIQLQEVSLTRVQPALAIVKAFEEVQQARVQTENTVNYAKQAANETLLSTAGAAWPKLFEFIEEYKKALALGNDDDAEVILAQINAQMEDAEVGGNVAEIIRRAESYQSEIETSLGRDARRYASLVRLYEQNPRHTVMQEWQRTMSKVFSVRDAERVYIPAGLAVIRLNVNALNEVAQLRRRASHEAAEQATMMNRMGNRLPYIQQVGDVTPGESGRQLDIGEGGPRGTAAPRR
jgi:membrane protease subunit HflK